MGKKGHIFTNCDGSLQVLSPPWSKSNDQSISSADSPFSCPCLFVWLKEGSPQWRCHLWNLDSDLNICQTIPLLELNGLCPRVAVATMSSCYKYTSPDPHHLEPLLCMGEHAPVASWLNSLLTFNGKARSMVFTTGYWRKCFAIHTGRSHEREERWWHRWWIAHSFFWSVHD